MAVERPILILGGTGLLGEALVRTLERAGRPYRAPRRAELDLELTDELDRRIDELEPSAVVNAAAWSDVTAAERPEHRAAAFRLNHEVPASLARALRGTGTPLVHVSTDYVFDGGQREPYVEDAPTAPLQVYGRSKLAGERAVLEAGGEVLVARTSTLFGPGRRARPSYVDAIAAQARVRNRLEVVRTPVASPTYAPDLAGALLRLLELGSRGVVHVVNEGACSRLELARAIVRLDGRAERVEVVARAQPAEDLARPAYCALDTARYRRLCGGKGLRTWEEALEEHLGARGPA